MVFLFQKLKTKGQQVYLTGLNFPGLLVMGLVETSGKKKFNVLSFPQNP